MIAEFAELPARSLATAVTVCVLFATVVVFHTAVYGAAVSVASVLPSTLNVTLVTPTLSEAFADNATDAPDTVAPLLGAVTPTVGAVVSAEPVGGTDPPVPTQ